MIGLREAWRRAGQEMKAREVMRKGAPSTDPGDPPKRGSLRKVVITGFAPSSRYHSPALKNSAGYELWTFNNDHELLEYSDRHFEMHKLSVYGKDAVDDVSPDRVYLNKLYKGLGIPVYMLKRDVKVPGSVSYPIDDIVARFGTYLTNSISYMLALAIYEKVDEIQIFGIDMARDHEHAWERPSIEYFIGHARGRGIPVYVPAESDLLKGLGLYGYIDDYEERAKLRERKSELERGKATSYRNAHIYEGAIEDLMYWERRGLLPGDSFPKPEKKR